MIQNNPLLLLVLIIQAFLFSQTCHALEVSAEGINKRQALNQALRQAIEMTLGTEVQSNTLVENFQLVRQQVLSHTKGYVKSYRILEEKTAPSGLVSLRIDAEVDSASIQDSRDALNILMQVAAHPRILVAPLQEDFDAISTQNDDFLQLTNSIEALLRDDFQFKTLSFETIRQRDKNAYRYNDRKNNLIRASQFKADFVVFVEVIRTKNTAQELRLEAVEVSSSRTIERQEIAFPSPEHIHAPSLQIARALVKGLEKEAYETGKRYELSFHGFDDKTFKYLETDLVGLTGYVSHKLQLQKKNALTLSYWSLLKAGSLAQQITGLLKGQDITFTYTIKGQQLSFNFDDPMFE